ncbi:Coagulation factor X [Liparis tanakae]|uniref:Coagulation factor X n=1 Tax=Liparis tanakae TaxID=230148 RepID=A0A4Z2EXM8_9TELE|nr:Coagulation factor X [Liparis tanakae]
MLQSSPDAQPAARRRATSCARRPHAPSAAPACRDSNYRPTGGAASPKVRGRERRRPDRLTQSAHHVSVSSAAFPCGRLPDGLDAAPPRGPWQRGAFVSLPQVSLLSSGGAELCGGVVLGRRSVLTAARCLLAGSPSDLRPSGFMVVAGEEETPVPVRALHVHHGFRPDRQDNDLALLELARPLSFGPASIHLCLPDKDFSENILMHSGRTGVATRRGGERTQDLVYMTLDECRAQENVSHPLSNKMFCMRSRNGPSGNQNGHLGNQNGHLGNQNGYLGNQNGPSGKQNGPSGNQKGHLGNQNGHLGNQNGPSGKQNGPSGNHNGHLRNQNGHLGNQNGPSGKQNRPSGNQNGHLGNQNGRSGNQNRPSGNQNGHLGNQNGPSGNQNGPLGNQNIPSGSQNVPLGNQNIPSGSHDGPSGRSERPSGSEVGGFLPGTPVATVEQGTAFLTGLLMAAPTGGGGLVFTKLSRYLSWIRPRLLEAEDPMTPQVHQDPEDHMTPQVGQDALHLVQVHVVQLHHLHRHHEGVQRELDEEDATADEEGLVLGQSCVEQQEVPLTETHRKVTMRFSDVSELHEVVLPQELMSRHVTLERHAAFSTGLVRSELVSCGLKWSEVACSGLEV